jgi:hypothetical protein
MDSTGRTWLGRRLICMNTVHVFTSTSIYLVLQEAEPRRHDFLANCASSRECRLIAEKLREIFLKYPVSAKYYDDTNADDIPSNNIDSIFKWG